MGGAAGTGGISSAGGNGAGGVGTGGGSSGNGGKLGTGGVNSGGNVGTGGRMTTGGNAGVGGVMGVGGTIGNGGVPPMGGSGGIATACIPGSVDCDLSRRCATDGQWHSYTCGPLVATDVTSIDASGLPGFDVGFRCKSLTVCGASQTCSYSASTGSGNLASIQSSEAIYYDGVTLQDGQAVVVQIAVGAASQCGDPSITIAKGEVILVGLSSGIAIKIFFPDFTGTDLRLYVREDGVTFYDAALTQRAGP
jgi:hypothetical protein